MGVINVLTIPEKYIFDIKRSISYIIGRNLDIEISEISDETIENLDREYLNKGYERYRICVDGRFYDVDCFTTVEQASYILSHLDSIQYLYSDADDWDTVIGDIDNYFKNVEESVYYIDFLNDAESLFTIESALKYLERRLML